MKNVLVTGGSRGIGAHIVEAFLQIGVDRVFSTYNTTEKLALRDDVNWINCNFSDRQSLADLCAVLGNLEIDILINNAGVNCIQRIQDLDMNCFDDVLNINLRSVIELIQATAPHMVAQNWGRIVNIGSIWSAISREGRIAYSASKFGLDGATLAISQELASKGVLVNMVSPGFCDTDLTRRSLNEAELKQAINSIPIGRLANPSEIAEVVVWLSSDRNTYICGQNIIVDGGVSRGR